MAEPVLGGRGGSSAEQGGVGAAGGQVAVTDVVDEAGEAVDGHQVVAPGARAGRTGPRGSSRRAALSRVHAPRAPGVPSRLGHRRLPGTRDGDTHRGAGESRSHCRHISRSTLLTQNIPFRTRRPAVRAARPVPGVAHYRPICRDSSTGTAYVVQRRPPPPGCPAHHDNTPIGAKIPMPAGVDVSFADAGPRRRVPAGPWRGTGYLPVNFSYALRTSSVGPSISSSPFSSHSTRSQVSRIDLLLWLTRKTVPASLRSSRMRASERFWKRAVAGGQRLVDHQHVVVLGRRDGEPQPGRHAGGVGAHRQRDEVALLVDAGEVDDAPGSARGSARGTCPSPARRG